MGGTLNFDFFFLLLQIVADPIHIAAEQAGEDSISQVLCSLRGIRET